MRTLALDTTTLPGSLALWRNGRVLVEDAREDPRAFGLRLPGWIFDVLAAASVPLADIDLFVVGAGPGSLTGLRVGIATMQGMALAAARPLVAVSALEAIGLRACLGGLAAPGDFVAAWMNAHRGEVFAALYEVAASGATHEIIAPVVGAPRLICQQWRATLQRGRVVVVGDAAGATTDAWAEAGITRVSVAGSGPLAGVMARLGAARAEAGQAGPPHAVRPLYVRRPDAEVVRERARAGAGDPTGHA